MLAGSEYLARHNRLLMVMAVAWAKEQNLLYQNVQQYQEKWKRKHVSEKSHAKLVGNFELNLRKMTTSRRPHLMLEEKQTKTMWIYDMARPQEYNIRNGKKSHAVCIQNKRERETERRPGIKVKVLPLVISAFGGGIKEILKEPANIFEKDD